MLVVLLKNNKVEIYDKVDYIFVAENCYFLSLNNRIYFDYESLIGIYRKLSDFSGHDY